MKVKFKAKISKMGPRQRIITIPIKIFENSGLIDDEVMVTLESVEASKKSGG